MSAAIVEMKLDEYKRREEELLALHDRNAALEGTCRAAGLCMSCLYGAPDPIGCTDCLNTGWDGGDPHSQIEVLEARVAHLEAALKHARGVIEVTMSDGNCDCRRDFAIIDAALKDAPQ